MILCFQLAAILLCVSSVVTSSATIPPTATRGVVYLDKWTFDKVITGRYPTIVKFDAPAGHSTAHPSSLSAKAESEWIDLVQSTHTIQGITFGQVPHHSLEKSLRDRFHLQSKDLPAFILFSKQKDNYYQVDDGKKDVLPTIHRYKQDTIIGRYTTQALTRFIRAHTQSIWMGQLGCMEHFDYMAQQLRTHATATTLIIDRAKDELQHNVRTHEIAYGKYYVEVFQRYTTQPGYIPREVAKLKRRRAAASHDGLLYTEKLNILNCFMGQSQPAENPQNKYRRKRKRQEEEDKYFFATGRIRGIVPEL